MDDHETESIWPEALVGHRLDDAVFAEAYTRISPLHRAWLKKQIAFLYALYAGKTPHARATDECLGPAGSVSIRQKPLAWTLVLTNEGFASPVRLLAACVPALCARVSHVAVLRTGADSPWPLAMALALELAGVENVFDAPLSYLASVCGELTAMVGPGLVIDLRAAGSGRLDEPAPPFNGCRPDGGKPFGIYAPGGSAWNFEALAFAHPDREFHLFGDVRGDFPHVIKCEGGLQEMLELSWEAAFVPAEAADQAMNANALTLTPGMETSWIWPGLAPQRFMDIRTALFDDLPPEAPERT